MNSFSCNITSTNSVIKSMNSILMKLVNVILAKKACTRLKKKTINSINQWTHYVRCLIIERVKTIANDNFGCWCWNPYNLAGIVDKDDKMF